LDIFLANYAQSGQFTVGPWTVTPALDRLQRNGRSVTVEPLAMAVLVYLARNSNQVIAVEDLTKILWPKRAVGDDAVYQRIHRLRSVLEDDAQHAKFIETIPKKGYRLIAPVNFIDDSEPADALAGRRAATVAILLIIAVFLGVSYETWYPGTTNHSPMAVQQEAYSRSIAILPFVDMSADQDQRYLGDGISEELIHSLSNVPGLKVVAQTSAFRFSDSKVNAQIIGEQLDVGTILEGSVRKQGDTLFISAQLVNVADGHHLWSRTFERNALDLYSVQQEIAAAVAQSFGASPREYIAADQQAANPSINAYDYYMLGRHHLRHREAPSLKQSITYFQRAIAMDPDFSRAYAGLALALVLNNVYTSEPQRDAMPGAMVAIEQALALDDEESEAYAVLGLVRSLQGELPGADSAFRRALEINPNYAMAYMWYAGVLNNTEREDEALRTINMAETLDPLSAHIKLNIGLYYNMHGQPEVAQEYWYKAIEVEPEYWGSYREFAKNLIATGKLDTAVLLINRYMEQVGDDAYFRASLALIWCYRALNDLDTAEFWLDRLTASSASAYLVNHERTLAFIARRDYEKTSELLHRWVGEALDSPQQLDRIAWYEMIIGHDTHAMRLYDRIENMRTEPAQLLGNLFDEGRLPFGHLPAVNAANLYLKAGQINRGRDLLDQSRQLVTSWVDDHRYRSGALYILASIHAIEGNEQAALTEMQRAIEAGWVRPWLMSQDPNLVLLREDPEFHRLVAELEAGLKIMLQRLRLADRDRHPV